jgi:hypothetical protein
MEIDEEKFKEAFRKTMVFNRDLESRAVVIRDAIEGLIRPALLQSEEHGVSGILQTAIQMQRIETVCAAIKKGFVNIVKTSSIGNEQMETLMEGVDLFLKKNRLEIEEEAERQFGYMDKISEIVNKMKEERKEGTDGEDNERVDDSRE